MGHQQLHHRIRLTAAVIACSAGFALGAGATGASSGGAASSGGGGGHAAAPAAAAPAAPAQAAAPSAPAQAAPGANPTTPAGNRSTPAAEVHRQQTPQPTPAAATNNGATHEHHRREQGLQYQTIYGNFWYPDAGNFGEYGNTNVPNTASNTDFSTNNDANPQPIATPTPAPATPNNNSTAIAAQADNAVTHSPEMVSVNAEQQRAQAAYEADRQRVIAQLADKPEYKEAVARQDDARKNMKDVKPLGAGVPGTPAPSVMDAAATKLDASDEVTKMQEAAIAADPQAAADKDKLTKLVGQKDAEDARLRSQH